MWQIAPRPQLNWRSSTSGGISDPEHDPSVLAETREVMRVILELIQTVDDDHYQGMMKLLQPVETEE